MKPMVVCFITVAGAFVLFIGFVAAIAALIIHPAVDWLLSKMKRKGR